MGKKDTQELKILKKEDQSVNNITSPVLKTGDIVDMIIEEKRNELDNKYNSLTEEIDRFEKDIKEELNKIQVNSSFVENYFTNKFKPLYDSLNGLGKIKFEYYNIFQSDRAMSMLLDIIFQENYLRQIEFISNSKVNNIFDRMGGDFMYGHPMGMMMGGMGRRHYNGENPFDEIKRVIDNAFADIFELITYDYAEVNSFHCLVVAKDEDNNEIIVSMNPFVIDITKESMFDKLRSLRDQYVDLRRKRQKINDCKCELYKKTDKIKVQVLRHTLENSTDGKMILENINLVKDNIDFGFDQDMKKLLN